jgi:tRNA A-37 threonylcarbamoyl transferase component Bud32
MQSIPFNQWYCHQEKKGASTLSFYLPEVSESKLSVLKMYWAGELDNLDEARNHKWGGHVRFKYCSEFETKIFFKRFSIRSIRHIHKPRRARATVYQEKNLTEARYTTPEIQGLIEHRYGGVLIDSAVVSSDLTGYTPLNLYLRVGKLRDSLSIHQRWNMARSLGKFIGSCHQKGFFHGDMHVANIMCKFEGNSVEFAWIDNEEGKRYIALPMRKRIHDLNHMNRARYAAPLTDRFRFWKGYCETCSLGEVELYKLKHSLAKMANLYQAKKTSANRWRLR